MGGWARRRTASAAILGLGLGLGLVAAAAEATTVYRWKQRPLVVFAASDSDPSLARQRQIVKALKPAFIDRKMVVVYVTGNTVSADLGPPPGMTAPALRERYGVGDGQFRVLLIGLDGGVKLTSPQPLSGEKLFDTIDSMPMRKDEQKGR